MSDHVSEKYCSDCMFSEFGIEESPCKGCADSLPHPHFEPALKEGDLIELAGATHKVAWNEASMYWLHRDGPAHNLQLFFDAGMSMDQVSDFFRAVDDSIMSDGSWPFMTMLQLVRCVHAIRNDCRFCTDPVTVEYTRMPRGFKTFKNAEELKGEVLQEGDQVVFTARGESVPYLVDTDYLTCPDGYNGRVFDMLDMSLDEKEQFAEEAYGYSLPVRCGFWPYSKSDDYAALTRLCLALYEKISTPVVLKSADDVLKYGLEHGTKIIFPGTAAEYTVEGRAEVYSDGLYLHTAGYRSNDFIFDELKLDADRFCTMMYGYKHKNGEWPETDGEDYPALTRAVVCLMHLAEVRETYKVKSLRADLAELVAQRESYEEDVQAAKQAVQEAEEAASQARLALSYEECALETLQEDIDGLEEAIEEALAGK